MEIEKYKNKDVTITNDVALYYEMLGTQYVADEFEKRVIGGQFDVDFSKMGNLSEEEKQQVWEVIIKMLMEDDISKTRLRINMVGVVLSYLKRYSHVREWDVLLRLYNDDNLSRVLDDTIARGNEVRWKDFKDYYYNEYKECLGREYYFEIPLKGEGRFSTKYDKKTNYRVKYEGVWVYVNSLSDVIDDYETRFPRLVKGVLNITEVTTDLYSALQMLSYQFDGFNKYYLDEEFVRKGYRK